MNQVFLVQARYDGDTYTFGAFLYRDIAKEALRELDPNDVYDATHIEEVWVHEDLVTWASHEL